MASTPPPLPPDVAQQASPQQAQSVFMQQGMGPQPGMQAVQMLMAHLKGFEQWFADAAGMIQQLHPPLLSYLLTMAQAFKQLNDQVQVVAKRSGMAQGSPEMPPVQQTNPAAGPPNPMQS